MIYAFCLFYWISSIEQNKVKVNLFLVVGKSRKSVLILNKKVSLKFLTIKLYFFFRELKVNCWMQFDFTSSFRKLRFSSQFFLSWSSRTKNQLTFFVSQAHSSLQKHSFMIHLKIKTVELMWRSKANLYIDCICGGRWFFCYISYFINVNIVTSCETIRSATSWDIWILK